MSRFTDRVRIGALIEPIKIYSTEYQTDEYGGSEPTEKLEHSVNATVDFKEPKSAEDYEAKRETSKVVRHFTIRYLPDITEKLHLVYEGQKYDILFVMNIGRKRFLKIEAQRYD